MPSTLIQNSEIENPYLKDLLWLLQTADLITSSFDGKPDLNFLGWNDSTFANWLLRCEEQLAKQQISLKTAGQKRLGIYHEALWKLLLTEAPAIQLLGYQLPIRDNKRTLGELDFLYRHRPSNQVFHLEVAIKYYLGLPQGPGQANDLGRWIGPAGLDSLAIKVALSEQKQLPLSDHPLARQQLQPLIPEVSDSDLPLQIHKQLALPGVLFYPWASNLPSPQRASQEHQKGWWLSMDAWPDFLQSFDGPVCGQLLMKPHWLALPDTQALLEQAALESLLHQHFKKRGWPLHLALYSASQGWQRIFLVNNTWPNQLPLLPR